MPDTSKLRYLRAMGIPVWVRRDVRAASPGAAGPDLAAAALPPGGPARVDAIDDPRAVLEALSRQVAQCTACALHERRSRTVFGVGDPGADWMLIGEGPGAEEDRQGEPFVGRAGQLLNAMFRALGLAREQVYIANIVKCRPPQNRDPRPEEVAACARYLERQIEVVRPRLILALGKIAAQNLLGSTEPLGRMRGRCHRHRPSGTAVVVTYHPAYLLRKPIEKRRAWEDLQFAQGIVDANS